jgi:peptide/nickel transport system ATP-binding protein
MGSNLMDSALSRPLVEVLNLKKYFPPRHQRFARRLDSVPDVVKAVDDVSFAIYRGETLALVGESGCGKSTTGETMLLLQRPTSGSIRFEGQAIENLSDEHMRRLRTRMQIVFQNPYSSLNPRMRVADILAEPLRTHGQSSPGKHVVAELLDLVQLPSDMQTRFPHELSGGQRQRIGIARALALRPDFVVLDEPVSALDVSIQAQICNLLKDLQTELKLTYLFISHDLRVVRFMSTMVAVMYLGRIVEIGPTEQVYRDPQHPYARALYSAVPRSEVLSTDPPRIILNGEIPSAARVPSGCSFHTRCYMAEPACARVSQQLTLVDRDHDVACMRVTNLKEHPYVSQSDCPRRSPAE